jgi:hypothetical protein
VIKKIIATLKFSVYNKNTEDKNLLKYKHEKSSYVNMKMPVGNLGLVTSHKVPCLRSDG